MPLSLFSSDVSLSVLLRLESSGKEIAREPVSVADLVDAWSELWWTGFARKGQPDIALDELAFKLTPVFKRGSSQLCAGFVLEATHPSGKTASSLFSTSCFQEVAARSAEGLREARVIDEESTFVFEVVAEKGSPGPSPLPSPTVQLSGTAKTAPLVYLQLPLQPILEAAQRVGPEEKSSHPVFYTAAALAKAEQFSWRGATRSPPEETGAVLVGVLCACPESGEMFCVVEDAIEATETEGTTFSLSYSSKTWGRLQAVIKARQSQPRTRAQRIVGQAHGHPFPPAGGAPPCDLCPTLAVCRRTNACLSSADRCWSRGVFARQPYQLAYLLGLNARGQKVHALFGLSDGRLTERGFHLIEHFEPAAYG